MQATKKDKSQLVLSSRGTDGAFVSGGSIQYDKASSSRQQYARPGYNVMEYPPRLLKQDRNVTTVSGEVPVSTFSAQKPDMSSLSGLREANQLLRAIPKQYMDGSFKILQDRIDSIPVLFANGTRKYHYLIEKMDDKFESLALNVYNKKFVEPLKKLSVAATIPPPAETLQSMFKTTDVLTQASRLFMPLPGKIPIVVKLQSIL